MVWSKEKESRSEMRITVAAASTAYRLQKVFKKPTNIYFQVKHATAKIFIDVDQSGAQSGGSGPGTDGMCLMAADTNPAVTPAAQPFLLQAFVGEIWYSSDTATADFVAIFIPNVGA